MAIGRWHRWVCYCTSVYLNLWGTKTHIPHFVPQHEGLESYPGEILEHLDTVMANAEERAELAKENMAKE